MALFDMFSSIGQLFSPEKLPGTMNILGTMGAAVAPDNPLAGAGMAAANYGAAENYRRALNKQAGVGEQAQTTGMPQPSQMTIKFAETPSGNVADKMQVSTPQTQTQAQAQPQTSTLGTLAQQSPMVVTPQIQNLLPALMANGATLPFVLGR